MNTSSNCSGTQYPKEDRNLCKFGPQGFFNQENLNPAVPRHLGSIISETANHALARNTWSVYFTSYNMLNTCNLELGLNMSLPMSEADVTTFIGWLLSRGLSAATISSYLAGLRQKQIALGLGGDSLRSPLVNQIIAGRRNQENRSKIMGNTNERIPVTPNLLLLIKKDLKTANMNKKDKLLIWSACTLMFILAE